MSTNTQPSETGTVVDRLSALPGELRLCVVESLNDGDHDSRYETLTNLSRVSRGWLSLARSEQRRILVLTDERLRDLYQALSQAASGTDAQKTWMLYALNSVEEIVVPDPLKVTDHAVAQESLMSWIKSQGGTVFNKLERMTYGSDCCTTRTRLVRRAADRYTHNLFPKVLRNHPANFPPNRWDRYDLVRSVFTREADGRRTETQTLYVSCSLPKTD